MCAPAVSHNRRPSRRRSRLTRVTWSPTVVRATLGRSATTMTKRTACAKSSTTVVQTAMIIGSTIGNSAKLGVGTRKTFVNYPKWKVRARARLRNGTLTLTGASVFHSRMAAVRVSNLFVIHFIARLKTYTFHQNESKTGNANRFSSKEECMNSCTKDSMPTRPSSPSPTDGGGSGSGGGGGDTADETGESGTGGGMSRACTMKPDRGPCYKYLRMWAYSPVDNVCRPFVYGGCRGNANRFESQDECEAACVRDESRRDDTSEVEPVMGIDSRELCLLAPDSGDTDNCLEQDTRARYYYDANLQTCTTFVYTGCGGNRNRFRFVSRIICFHFLLFNAFPI